MQSNDTVTLVEYRGGIPSHGFRAEVHRQGCSDIGKRGRYEAFQYRTSDHADAAAAVAAYLAGDLDGLASEDEVRVYPCA